MRGRILSIIAGFFVLSLILYGGLLQADFVHFDDPELVTQNPIIREISPSSVGKAFTSYDPELYVPLTTISYQIDHLIAGLSPAMFHFTNILLHTLNALLVLLLIYRVTRNFAVGLGCGLLFLIHPINVEAVAWVSARKDLLSSAFALGSMVAWLYSRDRDSPKWYLLSLVLFLLALLSKVSILLLPAGLFLLDWYRGQRWRQGEWIRIVPYLVFSVLFFIIALFGKQDLIVTTTLVEKFLMALRSLWFILGKLFLPLDLSVLYPAEGPIVLIALPYLLALILFLALALALAISFHRTKILITGLGLFLLFLIPSFVNFAKQGDLYVTSDRYAYMAGIGIFLIFATALFRLQSGLKANRGVLNPPSIISGILLIVLGWLSWQQMSVWADTPALFAHTLSIYPDSHVAMTNLANAKRRRGEIAESLALLEKAHQKKPQSTKILINLGTTLRQMKRFGEAIQRFNEALKIDPTHAEAQASIGLVLADQGRFGDAEAAARKALAMDPANAFIWNNLGSLLAEQNKKDEAMSAYRKAVEISPYFAQAWHNIAVLESGQSNTEGATAAEREAVKRDPTYLPSRLNLAILLAKVGDLKGAETELLAALRIDPKSNSAASMLQKVRAALHET